MDKSAALFRASNVILMDYSFEASLASALQVCDEAVVVVDRNSQDHTLDLVYGLQCDYGKDRVIVVEREWVWDRLWQEKVWAWCAEATDAEWLMYHDADEAMTKGAAERLRDLMANPEVKLISLPYIHLYGTPQWQMVKGFYPRNTRLGRRSFGYKMSAVCRMRYGDDRDAHAYNADGIVLCDSTMMHYGWCRNAQAMMISQRKQKAWYADGDGLEDGHIPEVRDYPWGWGTMIPTRLGRYRGEHPDVMQRWFAMHRGEWDRRNSRARKVEVGLGKYPTKMEIQEQIHGIAYIGDDELAALCHYAEDAKLPVEIGAGYGASAIAMLQHSKAPLVVSIDPFVTDGVTSWHSTREITSQNVRKLVGDDFSRWHLIEDYSYNVAPIWDLGPIDLLFLDGDHRYEHVKRDFEDWLPLMEKGGVILLHDSRRKPDPKGEYDNRFFRGWPGPTRLAEELRKDGRVELIGEVVSTTIWRVR